jgi:hypothetical protein
MFLKQTDADDRAASEASREVSDVPIITPTARLEEAITHPPNSRHREMI